MHVDPLAAGQESLGRGDWEGAAASFRAVLAGADVAPALEGLGTACWWLDDADGTLDARERAFRAYRAAGDTLGAARVGIALAWDSLLFGGRAAVARGWLERSRRMIDDLPLAPEHGWLRIREAELALRVDADPEAARRHATSAAAIARDLQITELEVVAIGLEGLAQVTAGDVDTGLRSLDEAVAAATGGDVTDLMWIGKVCCFLIYACEGVRDYERAAQWCDQVSEFCERWNLAPLFAVCRTQYASVLISRGVWDTAEAELEQALGALAPDSRREVHEEGTARLGELRRRQGRTKEAEALFARAPGHSQSQIGRAALALDRGDAAGATEMLQTLLRRLPSTSRVPRVAALELLVRAHAALGDGDAARAAAAALREIADAAGTPALRAAALAAEGVAIADLDEQSAVALIEQAVDAFTDVSPYEAARARLELATVLRAGGLGARARTETLEARSTLDALGADAAPASAPSVLSPRELGVLRLAAQGLANRDIAERLTISEHTVHRHMANIFFKLGVSSRAAATAYAASHGLL